MNTVLFGFIGMWETVAILAVVLVLFGAKKVPELARGLGQGIREFNKATREINQDLQRAFDEPPAPAPRRLPSNPPAAQASGPAPSSASATPAPTPEAPAKPEGDKAS